jgi:hypothetical protein
MNEVEMMRKIRRELHAAIAMHALILVDGQDGGIAPAALSDSAFAIADAMIEKGGPLK